jgi:hypothetical protein
LGLKYNKVKTYRANYDIGKQSLSLPKQGHTSRFDRRDLARLKEFISKNNLECSSVRNIKMSFESEICNRDIKLKNISPSTYYNWITKKDALNYSWKRVKKYCLMHETDLSLKIDRKLYCKKMSYLLNEGYEVIYLDECSLNLNFKPCYGYSLKGKPLYLPWTSPKSINLS